MPDPPGADARYNYGTFRARDYVFDDFPGPGLGETAPEVTVETLDGARVPLVPAGRGPLVVESGSLSCPVFVGQLRAMHALRARHPEARFVVLYTREAHPGERIPPHAAPGEKRLLAHRLVAEEGETREVLVDDVEGTAHRALGAFPNFVYVFDADRRVAFRSLWNDPRAVDDALGRLARGERTPEPASTPLPPPPWVAFRVLRRAGWRALAQFAVAIPQLLAKRIAFAIGRRRRSRGAS